VELKNPAFIRSKNIKLDQEKQGLRLSIIQNKGKEKLLNLQSSQGRISGMSSNTTQGASRVYLAPSDYSKSVALNTHRKRPSFKSVFDTASSIEESKSSRACNDSSLKKNESIVNMLI